MGHLKIMEKINFSKIINEININSWTEIKAEKPNINWNNLYNLSRNEQKLFFHYKEEQYVIRKHRISETCKDMFKKNHVGKDFISSMTIKPNFFLYMPEYNLTYCHIPKVIKVLVH